MSTPRKRFLGSAELPSLVVVVLVLSAVVASAIAAQAILAARQRQVISDTMLRQYAQLAALEFARRVRAQANESLQVALNRYAHPSADGRSHCQCAEIGPVEQWILVGPDGSIRPATGDMSAQLRDAVAKTVSEMGSGHGDGVRVAAVPDDPLRIIAIKPEPHLVDGPGYIGFVTPSAVLVQVFARANDEGPALPALLAGEWNGRPPVQLRVTDRRGNALFASTETSEGTPVVTTPVWPEGNLLLTVHAAMTSAFAAGLAPGPGGVATIPVVIGLVVVNGLLIVSAVWQIRRERELTLLRANFVAGVSHELRTPLAQIRMFSETLRLNRVRNDGERTRAVQIIEQESIRLSQLVDNVLQFHRGSLGASSGPGAPINLSTIVADVVESFAPVAASKRAVVKFERDGSAVTLLGDSASLRQVLLNLLDNAVKYGPPGQAIVVALQTSGRWAKLIVDDAGPGIPSADRIRIFNPFERGRDTRGAGGAGIGLAVVHEVVRAHGGRVSVDDAPSGGARVVIELPLAVESPAARM
jgi:signal transduction histidine kinase